MPTAAFLYLHHPLKKITKHAFLNKKYYIQNLTTIKNMRRFIRIHVYTNLFKVEKEQTSSAKKIKRVYNSKSIHF